MRSHFWVEGVFASPLGFTTSLSSLPFIFSLSVSAAFGKANASRCSILTFPAFIISTFPCAIRRASSEISHPVTSELGMLSPNVMAMQPDPVQISRIRLASSVARGEFLEESSGESSEESPEETINFSIISFSIHWQSSAVSGLGISTPGST